MTLVQMVVQIWLILISFNTNLHYRALCAIFIWESISSGVVKMLLHSGVVKMLLHSSHMDLELKMVSNLSCDSQATQRIHLRRHINLYMRVLNILVLM